ncbi:myelin-oligodendrocyte glycoprotein [Oreochromis niloticus]|uniref:myelin-oligodendrocyte glycoprotein n=1 Tax=Oreochromis niloticus TaxID=8128 RepID=UPI000DF36ED0|nr:myelin-oligodendrocyte glycoprotein-like [Oreochromis niloticus]
MIHLYDSSKKQHLSQDPVYRGHTEMNEDPLNTKDLILKLKDLHFTDSDVYTCTVYKKYGNILLQKVVTLKVKGGTKNPTGAQSKNTDASVVKPADG